MAMRSDRGMSKASFTRLMWWLQLQIKTCFMRFLRFDCGHLSISLRMMMRTPKSEIVLTDQL